MHFNGSIRGLVTLAILFFITVDIQSNSPAKYSPVGTWEYILPGVPEGYDSGIMVITENEEGLAVEIGPSRDYLMKAEKVEYNNKKLSFIIYVEYEEVKISGDFDDENFSGTVSYVEGIFDLTAAKITEP